jgi:hypothetical protein
VISVQRKAEQAAAAPDDNAPLVPIALRLV